jgi:hypothetical protein
MTDKEKLEKIKALADKMYSRMSYLTSDTRPIRQAMDEYHQFIINEYHKEEPVSEDLEEVALLYYPKMSRISEPHGVIPADNKSHYLGDVNEEKREGFIKGYHQAEKDLELTWEDISMLRQIMFDYNKQVRDEMSIPNNEDYCKEVLKRFKEHNKL